MKHPLVTTLDLLMPILVGVLAIASIWLNVPLAVAFLGLSAGPFSIQPIIGDQRQLQIGLSFVVVSTVILVQASRDYARFFPSQMDFSVYFDLIGLESAVNKLSRRERQALNIEDAWKDHVPGCLDEFNGLLKKNNVKLRSKPSIRYAAIDQNSSTGSGIYQYVINKAPGRQKYKVIDGWGIVRFTFGDGNQSTVVWIPFALKPGPGDYINISAADFVKSNKLVHSTFSQYAHIQMTPNSEFVDIVAPTKINLLPTVTVGTSVYCISRGGRLVPIGYALYGSL